MRFSRVVRTQAIALGAAGLLLGLTGGCDSDPAKAPAAVEDPAVAQKRQDDERKARREKAAYGEIPKSLANVPTPSRRAPPREDRG